LNTHDKDNVIPPAVYHYMDLRGTIKSLSIAIRHPTTKKIVGYLTLDKNNEEMFSDINGRKLRDLAATVAAYITLYPDELSSQG